MSGSPWSLSGKACAPTAESDRRSTKTTSCHCPRAGLTTCRTCCHRASPAISRRVTVIRGRGWKERYSSSGGARRRREAVA
jgi:hypothetical protein